jgi:hypothetical protein
MTSWLLLSAVAVALAEVYSEVIGAETSERHCSAAGRMSVHVAVTVRCGEMYGRANVGEGLAVGGNEPFAGTDGAEAHEPLSRILERADAGTTDRQVPVIRDIGPGEGESAFEQVVVGRHESSWCAGLRSRRQRLP